MHKVHFILGYLGLIPFIGLAGLSWWGWALADMILLSYAALIMSFLAGNVWAYSIEYKLHWSVALFSNGVMLLSWLALWLHAMPGILYWLAILMMVLIIVEYWQLGDVYESSFLKLRTILSLTAAVSLIVAEGSL
jgi:hypothetical protein